MRPSTKNKAAWIMRKAKGLPNRSLPPPSENKTSGQLHNTLLGLIQKLTLTALAPVLPACMLLQPPLTKANSQLFLTKLADLCIPFAIMIALSAFLYFLFFFLHFLLIYWYQISLPLTKIGEYAETSRNMLILEIHAIFKRRKFCFFYGVILHVSTEKY